MFERAVSCSKLKASARRTLSTNCRRVFRGTPPGRTNQMKAANAAGAAAAPPIVPGVGAVHAASDENATTYASILHARTILHRWALAGALGANLAEAALQSQSSSVRRSCAKRSYSEAFRKGWRDGVVSGTGRTTKRVLQSMPFVSSSRYRPQFRWTTSPSRRLHMRRPRPRRRSGTTCAKNTTAGYFWQASYRARKRGGRWGAPLRRL